MTAPDGIVLDADLAAKVPLGARIVDPRRVGVEPILTHLPTPTGLRPVAEVVADVDTLRRIATWVKGVAEYHANDGYYVTAEGEYEYADALDAIRVRLLDPALVDAWHAQHGGAS